MQKEIFEAVPSDGIEPATSSLHQDTSDALYHWATRARNKLFACFVEVNFFILKYIKIKLFADPPQLSELSSLHFNLGRGLTNQSGIEINRNHLHSLMSFIYFPLESPQKTRRRRLGCSFRPFGLRHYDIPATPWALKYSLASLQQRTRSVNLISLQLHHQHAFTISPSRSSSHTISILWWET